MTGRSEEHDVVSSLLPGRADDYLGTTVLRDDLLACLEERGGIAALLSDAVPLPRTEARDGHSDDRHLEYWLTGFQDAQAVRRALGLDPGQRQSILGLEYGGCGRVARHIARDLPGTRLFFGASHQTQVRFMNASFEGRVRAFRGPSFPHLPFADASFDGVFAFSVLPNSLDACAWLLEIRRVLKPDGRLYATVEDEESWSVLSRFPAGASGAPSDGPYTPENRDPRRAEQDGDPDPTASGPEQTRSPSSPLLSMLMRVFRIEAVEARSKNDEIGVVLSA